MFTKQAKRPKYNKSLDFYPIYGSGKNKTRWTKRQRSRLLAEICRGRPLDRKGSQWFQQPILQGMILWYVSIVSICHPLSVVACSSLVINPSLLSPGLFCCLQALIDPSMSWKETNLTGGKITFIPGKGINFLLASDVALYKDIQVTAFISYSLKRWMPMGRERAGKAQIQDLEPLCRMTPTATKVAPQHPLLQSLRPFFWGYLVRF